MAGATPAGAEVARRVGAAGGPPEADRDPAHPGRERLPSNPAGERGFRPTWPDECGIRPTATRTSPPEANPGPAEWPARPVWPDECATRPTPSHRVLSVVRTPPPEA